MSWLSKFVDYTYPYGEAPEKVYRWVGILSIAAAMRRRVWLDRGTFKWYPNLYLMFLAKPGIVAKSTTLDRGGELLREVPGVYFGPSTATWQSMFPEFDKAKSTFTYQGKDYIESSMVCMVSELGNFVKRADQEMLDQMINWWDGKGERKTTLHHGEYNPVNPLLCIAGCATPAWFHLTFSSQSLEGGFLSRCLIVYTEGKEKFIPNPAKLMQGHESQIQSLRSELVVELRDIAQYCKGPVQLTKDAEEWGDEWYINFHKNIAPNLPSAIQTGYVPRKQAMVYKVAMVLSASYGTFPTIDLPILKEAMDTVSSLEDAMFDIMSKIGVHETVIYTDRIRALLSRRAMTAAEIHRTLFQYIPSKMELDTLLVNMCHAGIVKKDGSKYSVV